MKKESWTWGRGFLNPWAKDSLTSTYRSWFGNQDMTWDQESSYENSPFLSLSLLLVLFGRDFSFGLQSFWRESFPEFLIFLLLTSSLEGTSCILNEEKKMDGKRETREGEGERERERDGRREDMRETWWSRERLKCERWILHFKVIFDGICVVCWRGKGSFKSWKKERVKEVKGGRKK